MTPQYSQPIQARALMHMKHSTISPWLVPELTGVQWVEPLPQASYIACPLIQLTRKSVPFEWDTSCRNAFKHLKTLMCAKPILQQPDYTKAFFLATDTSAYSVGTILLQEGELNPRTQQPMLCPVAYYSSIFTPAEQNYNIYKREFLEVLKALKCFRPHVAATEIPVTILMDHANLTHWKAT